MLTKYCPNCNSQIKINSEHVKLSICPHCKKCVMPIDNIVNIQLHNIEQQEQLVRCPNWNNCEHHKLFNCEHFEQHINNYQCKISCKNQIGMIICNENCR